MQTSTEIDQIAAAGAKAQQELRPALKDAVNPAFRSRYADLSAVVEAAKVYAKHGIAVWQDVTLNDIGASVVTRLTHASGQWIEFGPLTVPLGKRDAHGVGSATTYAKRYALSAALCIVADEDDDGNAAADPGQQRAVAAPVMPEGFEDWWSDMAVAADNGLKALQEAWGKSAREYRDYVNTAKRREWEAIKDKAKKAAPEAA